MNIALISNNVCVNVAVFPNMESANSLLGNEYELVECPIDYGIGDIYTGGVWIAAATSCFIDCPQCGAKLLKDNLETCLECGFIFS